MSDKPSLGRCAVRVQRDARYLSARNVSGVSWVKCGNKAIAVINGRPICKKHKENRHAD